MFMQLMLTILKSNKVTISSTFRFNVANIEGLQLQASGFPAYLLDNKVIETSLPLIPVFFPC